MTRAIITSKDGNYYSVEVYGHALFGDYGNDVVCAGISSVVIGGLNALHNSGLGEEHIEIIENHIYFTIEAIPALQMIVYTIIKQLETIQDRYPEHIKLIFK